MRSAGLVILDCDGVVVDSEPVAIAALAEFLQGIGLPVAEDYVYRHFLGRSWTTVTALLARDYQIRLSAEEVEAYKELLFERIRTRVEPMPGIAAAIAALDRPACIASSSTPERLTVSLGKAGLSERFEGHVYSASLVKNGKPAPDLFLHAAAAMGYAPEDCLVVEDSPAGIAAGLAAGMVVAAFLGGSHIGPGKLRPAALALGPAIIFDSMAELPAVLARFDALRPA
ncbi:HAD family hydrolase [Roseococcus sp.]|uniref:HAD family hydrolase n=1 Tax=Roseococcus sp. TaxID=2109646 RepID=UPI003BAC86A5